MIKVNEAYTINRTDETTTALNDCWVLVSRKARSKELHISVANGAEGSKNAVLWMKDNKRVFVTLFNLSRLVSYVDEAAEWGEGAQQLFGKNLLALQKVDVVGLEGVEGLFYNLLRAAIGTFEYESLSFGGLKVPLLEDEDWLDGIVYDYNIESDTLDLTPYMPCENESEDEFEGNNVENDSNNEVKSDETDEAEESEDMAFV